MNALDKNKLNLLLNTHRKIYNDLNVMVPPLVRGILKPILDEMKKMTAVNLAFALKNYNYSKDLVFGYNIPIIQPPEITILRAYFDKKGGAGNCNDSAKLLEVVRGAKVWVILKELQNNTDAGHFVAIKDKEIWSNFRLEDKPFKDIRATAAAYVSDWKYIIYLTPAFTPGEIIER